MEEYTPKYPLHTLSKALEILNYIKDCPTSNGATLAALSHDLGISKSSAHRILDTLLAYGFVEKTGGAITTYRLGWSAYKVGNSVLKYHTLNSSDYVALLEDLAVKLKRTVSLDILSQYSAIVMYKVDPNNAVPAPNFIGERNPLYATASGKLFMLDFTNEEIRAYFKNTTIKKYTPNTILNYIDFLDELAKIKLRDYSINNCEYREDSFCISMPVRDYTKRIAATISVSAAPQTMGEKEVSEIIPVLREACRHLSKFLGE
ncbi:IclR family transcriptional regulator [Anaerotignum faecicola]|nr:IclR family transcriptional regulator [Anaerotignum faecicola]